ncbi:phospholipid phosphatase [Paenibacillus marchantiophytorum]|uniref:Phospholipid phosphatase n=1 Tax=Paenibacillus marchantiophytorum TaxID=1619310 RepID=A0ABQ1FH57_9BACL|nr:phosphatase PAP2 family protein [Paenibacillus marchantiophytorum]GGA13198.1 phospholipid phosphatase [Paenibacillus marchantiophytorum]
MATTGTKRFIWGFLLVWIILMAIFTFTDLQVSQMLYNEEHSKFGWFFEVYGEHPAFIVLFASGNILFSTVREAQWVKKMLVRLVAGMFILMGGFSMFFMALNRGFELAGGGVMLISLASAVLLAVILQWMLKQVSVEKLSAYNRAAWAGIVIVFAEIMVVNVLKIFWGRMRFRNMEGDYSQFTRWFLPQGIQENGVTAEAHKSFPSGHSANGWTMMVWMLFMPFVNKWRSIMLVVAMAWGLCTSTSRVIMGDHFATDVLSGAFITITSMLLICKLMKVDVYLAMQTNASISLKDKNTPYFR